MMMAWAWSKVCFFFEFFIISLAVSTCSRPASGVASIGVLGSTGSYMYLSSQERARALSAAIEAAGDVPLIAGIGAMRTSWVIENAKTAEAVGAAGLLLAPGSYLPLLDDEVVQLASDVSAATNLPVCIYNNPGTTHFNVSEELVARLAEIPRVKAVKNPAPLDADYAAQLKRLRRCRKPRRKRS